MPLIKRNNSNLKKNTHSDLWNVKEKEIFCSLRFENEILKAQQKELSLELANIFEHGDENTARDLVKAKKYRGENPFDFVGLVFTLHGIFTGIRHLLSRTNRLLSLFKLGFLPAFFSIFGLSYGINLIVDIGIILHSTFRLELSDFEKKYSFWERTKMRFKNVVMEDGRLNRMTNDGFSFAANLAVWLCAGPLALGIAPFLNIVISSSVHIFDAIHDAFFTWFNFNPYKQLAKKIDNHISKVRSKIDLLKDKREYFKQNYQDDTLIAEKLERNIAKHNRLLTVKHRLAEKTADVKIQLARQLILTTVVLMTMLMIFFPPAAPAAGFILTVSAAALLATTNIITGSLTNFIYQHAKEKIPKLWTNIKETLQPKPKVISESRKEIHSDSKENKKESYPVASIVKPEKAKPLKTPVTEPINIQKPAREKIIFKRPPHAASHSPLFRLFNSPISEGQLRQDSQGIGIDSGYSEENPVRRTYETHHGRNIFAKV